MNQSAYNLKKGIFSVEILNMNVLSIIILCEEHQLPEEFQEYFQRAP